MHDLLLNPWFWDDDDSTTTTPLILSDNDLAALRALVGTTPTDGDLETRYLRLQNIYAVANEALNIQLTAMINAPAQFGVSGQYSENRAANIAALEKQIAYVQNLMLRTGALPASTVATMKLKRKPSDRPFRGRR